MGIGKEAFYRVPGLKHSTKCTRGKILCILGLKWLCLPSVCAMTLGKEAKILCHEEVFAEGWTGTHGKKQSLPSAGL